MSSGINRIEIRRAGSQSQVCRRWAPAPIADWLGIEPAREIAAQQLAAARGLAPAVLAFDAAKGEFSMVFIEGLPLEVDWERRPERVELLLRIIQTLRVIPANELPEMDLIARLLALHDRLAVVDAARARQWTLRVQRCVDVWRALQAEESQRTADQMSAPVLVHGDLCPQNILRCADGTPCLLDWEYAHRGHPDEDLAGLVASLSADSPLVAELARYSIAPELFDHRVELRRLLDALWYELARVITPQDPASSA